MRQNRILFSTFALVTRPLLLAGLLTLAGCGDGRIATYPATGTVMVDGQPADGALVIFCPVEGSEEFMRQRPMGRTEAGGKYELFTFDSGDGAPAGSYKVMVRWEAAGPQSTDQPRDDRQRKPPDRLRGRYFNPETSGLTATIDEGPTEVPPFDLKTR